MIPFPIAGEREINAAQDHMQAEYFKKMMDDKINSVGIAKDQPSEREVIEIQPLLIEEAPEK